MLGRGRLQVPNKGVDGVLHFVRHRLPAQDRVALLAYNRATAFTTDHESSLVPILERYARAHEAIESRLALHFSGLAGVYQVAEFPAALQTDIDAIFGGPAAAARTTVPAMENRNRSDADYRRRVADVLIGDPSASLADRVEAAIEDLPFDTFVAETASRLAYQVVDGRHVGSVEVAVFAIDGGQRQVADLWQRVELDLSDATYQRFRTTGIPYSAQIVAPGAVRAVKIVVYDYAADLVGSVTLTLN